MRRWLNTVLKLVWGAYLVLTSLYCLLAYLPYTYYALIKAPAYAWMPWFTHHQAGLFWIALAGACVAYWSPQDGWRRKDRGFAVWLGMLAAAGLYITFRPFLPGLENNRAAYVWSLAALLPLAAVAAEALWRSAKADLTGASQRQDEPVPVALFVYSSGLASAFAIALIYTVTARIRMHGAGHSLGFHSADSEILIWSLLSHVVLAIAILSVLNLVFLLSARTARPRFVRRALLGALATGTLWTVLVRFLENALSFDGWGAHAYAASLALALTLWGMTVLAAFSSKQTVAFSVSQKTTAKFDSWRTLALWGVMSGVTLLALASPWLIGGEDWNGLVESTVAFVVWIVLSVCLYRLRPARANYSATAVVGTLLLSAMAYKGLQATEILWSKPLGTTDDEIALKLEEYGGRDASFQLAHHMLGNSRNEKCGDLCRILREYTNIRDNRANTEVRLVDNLTATTGSRPNIFLFVIDSMRPDYLGAYNPQVDYTPRLDAFAKEKNTVTFRNAYTQYAGTTLSEPAIWSGAMLLHTHYLQPFSKVNSLETMARTDGYQTVVSYDTVLTQLLSPADDLIKLDADKTLWNQYEACSTIEQLEGALDRRTDKARPVLFYAQPMNVHQFARNNVPSPSSQHWPVRAGFNSRITYEVHWVDSCLGSFFSYLKQRGMYENSIIIVASDHGDATGEYGRYSHSTSIWPEIMRVPLIMHLPAAIREQMVYDPNRIVTLTDITPTLYYLLGHKPIRANPLYGQPLFARSRTELDGLSRGDIFLASDVRAVYGILADNGRYLYVTYDSPAQSYLFDLSKDANAEHSLLTAPLKRHYDEEIIEDLHLVADFYGYKPGVGSLLAAVQH